MMIIPTNLETLLSGVPVSEDMGLPFMDGYCDFEESFNSKPNLLAYLYYLKGKYKGAGRYKDAFYSDYFTECKKLKKTIPKDG